ncbi:MAG: hypothetical protein AAB617_01010 [Patescibacteria group bacterium]
MRYIGSVILAIMIGGLVYYTFLFLGKYVDFNDFLPPPMSTSTTATRSSLERTPPRDLFYTKQGGGVVVGLAPVAPSGFTASDLSQDYGKVTIGSTYPAYSDTSISQVTLNGAYSLSNKKINISGWKIKTNKSEVTIGRGVNNYNPFEFPSEGDITIGSGDYVGIYGVSSPVGKNIRLNRCTGYLNKIYDFKPPLQQNCPYVNRNDIVSFSGRCQSFILSLSSCQAPTPNESNLYANEDVACRSFINKINFNGCYSKYSNNSDFLSPEWRVWIGNKIPLDLEHDRVLLLDRFGLLVDERIY